jgi:hypothetical protein
MGIPPRPKSITATGIGPGATYVLDRYSSEVAIFVKSVPNTAQTGVFTPSTIADTETITIGSTTYTIDDPLVDVANAVTLAASDTLTVDNLVAAINGTGTRGTDYGTLTPINPDVTAANVSGTLVVTARHAGVAADSIATTDAMGGSWAAATLVAGTYATWKIEHTFDDVFDSTVTPLWEDHASLTAQVEDASGNYTVLPVAMRAHITAAGHASDAVTMTVVHHP